MKKLFELGAICIRWNIWWSRGSHGPCLHYPSSVSSAPRAPTAPPHGAAFCPQGFGDRGQYVPKVRIWGNRALPPRTPPVSTEFKWLFNQALARGKKGSEGKRYKVVVISIYWCAEEKEPAGEGWLETARGSCCFCVCAHSRAVCRYPPRPWPYLHPKRLLHGALRLKAAPLPPQLLAFCLNVREGSVAPLATITCFDTRYRLSIYFVCFLATCYFRLLLGLTVGISKNSGGLCCLPESSYEMSYKSNGKTSYI